MKKITNLMVSKYMTELGCDFMGYKLQKGDDYDFHHMIIPKRDCKKFHVPNNGYIEENGAVLCHKTSHQYIHQIERYDAHTFGAITDIMTMMNRNGVVDEESLLAINDLLEDFEERFEYKRTKKGKMIIKEEYKDRLYKKK